MMRESSVSLNIVAIDDDPIVRRILTEALDDMGHIHLYDCADLALQDIQRGTIAPDLLIVDIVMPGMSGLDFCRAIRAIPSLHLVSILVYSSHLSEEMERLIFDAGANDFLEKPMSIRRLQMKVQPHLRAREYYCQLKLISMLDPLTGLLNRQSFQNEAEAAIKRVGRMNGTVGLLFLDMNRFKQINDQFGHHAGDECLRRFGTELNVAFAREGDLCARFGGDEFVALTLTSDQENVFLSAENLISRLSELKIPIADESLTLSCAIGIATHTFEGTQPSNPMTLLECLMRTADQQCYEAKATSRQSEDSSSIAGTAC